MRISLFSIDPLGRGGAYTSALAVYNLLQGWGLQPALCYLSGSLSEGLTPRELIRRRRLWDAREQIRRSMQGLAVGHVAAHFPSLAYNWWPYPVVRHYLNQFPMFMVLGIPICGITSAALHKPYICWTSTLYGDELVARARGGESWAEHLLESPHWPLMAWQERLVLRQATHILAISHHTAARIRSEIPEVARKVQVLSWPIDTDVFHPPSVHSSERRNSGEWILISVGRLDDPRKDISTLLAALPLVGQKVGKVRLKLVGSGAESLPPALTEVNSSVAVECLGRVPRDRLVREFQSADLFVLPSRQEGLGLVVLEAMACGLPVVSTLCGGPEEFVRGGETGYLVPQEDPKSIAAAIFQILRDPNECRDMGKRARRLVLRNNSHSAVGTQLQAVLEEVYPRFAQWTANGGR